MLLADVWLGARARLCGAVTEERAGPLRLMARRGFRPGRLEKRTAPLTPSARITAKNSPIAARSTLGATAIVQAGQATDSAALWRVA